MDHDDSDSEMLPRKLPGGAKVKVAAKARTVTKTVANKRQKTTASTTTVVVASSVDTPDEDEPGSSSSTSVDTLEKDTIMRSSSCLPSSSIQRVCS